MVYCEVLAGDGEIRWRNVVVAVSATEIFPIRLRRHQVYPISATCKANTKSHYYVGYNIYFRNYNTLQL